VVAVTGPIDYVTDGARVVRLENGAPMMTRVTALGCSVSALVAAALAVEADPLHATVAALAWMAIAGEIAATDAAGPGTLQPLLLDALFSLDDSTLLARVRLT
jgi:hydroxyethylthiazole kinase